MSTISIWVESNIPEIAGDWAKFVASMPIAFSEWGDTVRSSLVDALRTQAPVGRRIDPRTSDRPHMRDRIIVNRTVSGDEAMLQATTNVGLYPYYVIEGRKGGKLITPKRPTPRFPGGILAWIDDGGEWRYKKAVRQGAAKPNPFNKRAWDLVKAPVMTELVSQIGAQLEG